MNVTGQFQYNKSMANAQAAAAAAPSPFAAGQDEEVMEDAFSVPAFTPEEEERERQSLTEDERRKIVADLCGLADDMAGLRVSNTARSGGAVDTNPSSPSQQPTLRTPAELERNMNLLNAELDAIPHQKKEAYLLALLQCPDQVFGGWRGEVIVEMQQQHQQDGTGRGKIFDAKIMAKKLVDYWQRRLETFGEDLAFKPMTLAGAMEEELGSMISFSEQRISPCKDAAGRAVLVITPRRRIRSLYPTRRQKRAFWYVLECLSQDPEARRNGAVIILDANGLNPTLFDPKFVRWAVGSAFDLFPIEWKAMHFFHTDAITSRVVIPSFKFFLKKEKRNRILVHSGKTSADTLAQYRLPPECLPSDLNLGGMVEIDIMKWVSDRYAFEGADMSGSSGGDDPEDDNTCSHEPMSKRSKTTPSPLSTPPLASLAVQDSSPGVVNSSSALVGPDISSAMPSIEAVSLNGERIGEASGLSLPDGAFVMTKEEEKLLAKDTGRKSDKRMDRAIVLCLRDPDADKTSVLITAGFNYHKSEKKIETKLLDDEGVSLRQRKNQLCRRLRQIVEKQREAEGKKGAANCA